MPKLKKRKSKDYTIISNTMLRDKSLGGMERGLFLTMWSLPDNWDFSIKGLCAILPDLPRRYTGEGFLFCLARG